IPSACPTPCAALLRRSRRVAGDAVGVHAGPAEPFVAIDEQVRLGEVEDRRAIPVVGVVDLRVLRARTADARLPPCAVALPRLAGAVLSAAAGAAVARAAAAAHHVDLERLAALVHVPEELEDRRIGGLAREEASRLPDPADRARLERLDEQIGEVDREDT